MQSSDQAMQQYRDWCTALLARLEGVVARSTLDQARHLMAHGEPSIGVEYLAHGIVQAQATVPDDVVVALRALVLDEHDLPATLDDHIRRPG